MAADPSAFSERDIRMRGFARRTTVEAAVAWVDAHARRLPGERVSLWETAGRVLAADVVSTTAVPGFARSMMDGYALRAAETLGATAYNRLALSIVGQSLPGKPFAAAVGPGQAVRIMTGAPLPAGADAVLPAERAEEDRQRLLVLDEVPPGKNVGQAGEDVAAGATVLTAGRRRPRVRIVVTGNELLPAGSAPQTERIVDANGPMLAALAERDGGVASLTRTPMHPHPGPLPEGEGEGEGESGYLVPDDPAAILAAMRDDADLVLVSGGSSVGQEDHAPLLLARHGELAIHGIAMRPSSPAGMGRLDDKLVFLLPGNPVSCLCAYDFFAGRAIRLLGGQSPDWPYGRTQLPLLRKLVSQVGRVDYARVRIVYGQAEPLAISGASILSSTTAADGFVIVPADSEGYPAGAIVEVLLYD
jgi:molybdopterin molybdotransferase